MDIVCVFWLCFCHYYAGNNILVHTLCDLSNVMTSLGLAVK